MVPQNSLLGLPEELLHLVADALLHKHLPSALRLRQASTALRGRLAAVRAAAEARRLRWVPELTDTDLNAISDEGRRLTMMGYDNILSWAAGPLLPTAGRVSFSVRIEESNENRGGLVIGVCNEAGTCAWGLRPYDGKLFRHSRTADGQLIDAPPPEGWSCGGVTQVMVDEAGQPANLNGRATGAVIEVIVDHSEGSLAFRVNGKLSPALRGFPKGAPLRPWARLAGFLGDKVRFAKAY